jgi:hypothetical protein
MKTIFSLVFMLMGVFVFAQVVNVNPDPYGDPWIAGDALPMLPEVEANLHIMQLTPQSAAKTLPAVVKNNELIYMPPVFDQEGTASCVQAAEVWYCFAYEINRLRDVKAGNNIDTLTNLYHPFFTYNFLNKGYDTVGTAYGSGFDIVKRNGCPSLDDYDDPSLDIDTLMHLYWMDGYDKYYRGMFNKVDSSGSISWDSTYNSLELLKHWLADHNNGEETGGLAVIDIYAYSGWQHYAMFDYSSPEYGKHYVTQWGTAGSHSLTLVGYHDSVQCFDINGDSIYANIDTNNNGVIELFECELGAFLAVNSWGEDALNHDDGYIYIPYLMMEGLSNPYTAITCYANAGYEPQLTVKSSVVHPYRQKIGLSIGYAENADSIEVTDYEYLGIFKSQGGAHDFRGAYDGPIEFGLDFSHSYINEDFGKIFLRTWSGDYSNTYEGYIDTFSIVDYRWNEEFHLGCDTNFPFQILQQNPSDFIDLHIDYDLIVPGDDQIIDQNVNLFSNMVSRFNPTVRNNASLTIEDSVEIDMYNSIIEIEEGASLIIGDNVVFTGKSGQNELLINGNIQIGKNVQFINIDNIFLNNENQQITINNAVFNQSFLLNKSQGLSINKCTFSSCDVLWSTRGNLTIDSSDFYCTWLLIDNLYGSASDVATITSNNISGYQNCPAGIYISDYDKFLIARNSIDNCGSGIQIYESGWGISGNQNVFDNEISNCSNKGLNIYNSRASIAENYIHGNEYGVWIARNSQVAMVGNAAAYYEYETQQIKDNNSYEIYASEFSFPWYCKYNVIIDNDNSGNPTDPLVYFDYTGIEKKDIRYNCWGTGFSATDDLYPVDGFFWDPQWCPPGTTILNGLVEQLYFDAIDEYENGNFAQAQQEFEYIIDNYPATKYAENAIRDLFSIEQFLDHDYAALIQYFENNNSIQNNLRLKKLAHFLSNRCNTKLEDWQLVIDHYEDIIDNPETPADSIFAIIDLGYTYLLMEASGNKSYYQGKMTEYIPGSKTQFVDQKTYLLSLLPFTKESEDEMNNESAPKLGELQQNIPNPFRRTTTIPFKTYVDASVTISVCNHTGREIISQELGYIRAGENNIQLDLNELVSGIYLYSLIINGQNVDCQKMILLEN